MNQIEHRYAGAKQFETIDKDIFFGREEDIEKFYRLIKLESLLVLYGKSGLGKSSLLNAGIFPKVLADGFFEPMRIRFKGYDETDNDRTPLSETQNSIRRGQQSVTTFLDKLIPDEDTLWHDVKEHQILNNKNLLLIFDQFEELFTYPNEIVEDFKEQLAEVVNSNIPQRYWDVMEQFYEEDQHFFTPQESSVFQQSIGIKIVLAIRSDKMHLLDKLSNYLPTILKRNYELKPLTREQATAAITEPALTEGVSAPTFTYSPSAVQSIIDFLTKNNTQSIESTQLQIVCESLEKKGIKEVTLADVGSKELQDIIENYYTERIDAIEDNVQREAAQRLIETKLIFEEERRRISLFKGLIRRYISEETLDQLVDSYILRGEQGASGDYFELSHDTLIEPVLKAKKLRLKKEEEEKEEKLKQERVEKERIEADERLKKEKAEMDAERQKNKQEQLEREVAFQKKASQKARRNVFVFALLSAVAILTSIYAFMTSNEIKQQRNEVTKHLETAKYNYEVAQENLEKFKNEQRRSDSLQLIQIILDADVYRNAGEKDLVKINIQKADTIRIKTGMDASMTESLKKLIAYINEPENVKQ